MPSNDLVDILLSQNQWATAQIFSACENLTDEQFHQKFEMGFGSLHDTLTHMLAAMRVWGDVLAERPQRPRLEGTRRPIAELKSILNELSADLLQSAKAHPLDGKVVRERGGKTYVFERAEVVLQVATHGFHHRAQCLNMLRQLGVSPLPPSSIIEWTLVANPPS